MRGGGYESLDDNARSRGHWVLVRRAIRIMWPSKETAAHDGLSHAATIALKIRIVITLILLLVGKLAELVSPLALKMAVDALTQQSPRFPLKALLVFGGSRIAAQSMGEIRNIIYASVSASAERLIALETFEHLQALSLTYHLKRKIGSVLRSVSRGASSFSAVLRVILFNIVPVVVQVLIVCIFLLLRYEWWFALITFCSIFAYFIFTVKITQWRNKFRRRATDLDNAFNQKATDALLNFETVKFFNSEGHEKNRYDVALKEYRLASIASQQTLSVLNIGQNVILSFGVVLSMWLAASLVASGKLTAGDFILIQSFIFVLYQPLGFLGTYYSMLRQYLVDIESMLTILEEPIDIVDVPDASPLVVSNGLLEFRNVRFGYHHNNLPVLRNISFKVLPGQRVAVVGPSGAGKSTLARLCFRFYDVLGGKILIDGQNIATCQKKSLRAQIGIVPQDTVLFNDSIRYNIGYGSTGKSGPPATTQQIDEAAKAASIYNFIKTQPEGYSTMCGERGLRLSGGEKQRVAIARAILKDPAIMVFDEATSSLDTPTERAIQQSLDAVSVGRSTLIIAHRLSTIVDCDNIIVLKDGGIIEQGTHQQLLELNGEYLSMWEKQKKNEALVKEMQQLDTAVVV